MELTDYAILKVLSATGPTTRRQAAHGAWEYIQEGTLRRSRPVEHYMAEIDRLVLLRLVRYDYGLRSVEITEAGKKELGEMSNRLQRLSF
ncbi:MAG: hypothetical protein M0000_07315 [Actinomycetota bacterium]|nr:hypothetical protein [Actinomycetota bacterium]